MIIEARPGEIVDVPASSDFNIRFATPFTANEMNSATLTVEYVAPDKSIGAFEAEADNTDMVLVITPAMLPPGFYEMNPVAIIAGRRRTWPIAAGFNALPVGVSRASWMNQDSIQ